MFVTKDKHEKVVAERDQLKTQLDAINNGSTVSSKKLKSIRSLFGDAGKEKGFKTLAAVKELVKTVAKSEAKILSQSTEISRLTAENENLTKTVKGMKNAPKNTPKKPSAKSDPADEVEEEESEELSDDKVVTTAHDFHEIASNAGK